MSMIQVFSRSPIAHQFEIVSPDGIATTHVIQGVNSHQILTGGVEVPFVTEMPEAVFNQIKEKYKSHPWLFGGKHPETGVQLDAQIYAAKNTTEATKKMKDSKPVLDQSSVVGKTAGIEKFKEGT
jgi:hypothetical protein